MQNRKQSKSMEEKYRRIAERINRDNHFLQSSRMRVKECGAGYAILEMDLDEQLLNIYGLVHGGALFSLADTAAGAASFTTGRDSVTLNSSINYIRPASGGKLKACASEIHAGKTTGVYEVFIYDDQEHLLSRATFTMFFLDEERKKAHPKYENQETSIR
ncbi:PaaI family thioesterase [Ileibacterium valens]|uniref:Thioesterase n=1 Tax=Ileibacterium valens TaxID=1862668 RepID=A0A1U7NJ03_9FIRM|nr:PaaI family thioesterase [Ileibacterium valens]OLU42688.1 thioesterase [Erysipelotrichaceae bacterium NYU-BL-F16]OLU42720.1 thioesterase [Erysipelotrichaceae bacterium NYU-BL-E8]OLU42850.1 thioesterase [Ileibacterium valens]